MALKDTWSYNLAQGTWELMYTYDSHVVDNNYVILLFFLFFFLHFQHYFTNNITGVTKTQLLYGLLCCYRRYEWQQYEIIMMIIIKITLVYHWLKQSKLLETFSDALWTSAYGQPWVETRPISTSSNSSSPIYPPLVQVPPSVNGGGLAILDDYVYLAFGGAGLWGEGILLFFVNFFLYSFIHSVNTTLSYLFYPLFLSLFCSFSSPFLSFSFSPLIMLIEPSNEVWKYWKDSKYWIKEAGSRGNIEYEKLQPPVQQYPIMWNDNNHIWVFGGVLSNPSNCIFHYFIIVILMINNVAVTADLWKYSFADKIWTLVGDNPNNYVGNLDTLLWPGARLAYNNN